MLGTWGGDGFDTITQDELDRVGLDTCKEYCKDYCWNYGFGYCPSCALEAARSAGKKMVEDE